MLQAPLRPFQEQRQSEIAWFTEWCLLPWPAPEIDIERFMAWQGTAIGASRRLWRGMTGVVRRTSKLPSRRRRGRRAEGHSVEQIVCWDG